jgi:hypothetical protein
MRQISNEIIIWFFEKINKIDKPLAILPKIRQENTQSNKIRNEIRDVTKNTDGIQRIIREYFKNLYSNKLENVEEMDTFLDTYDQKN